MAIYQGNTKISGAGIAVDSALSDSSTNPVQNQAITNALEDVGYDTWQKPADWIDIRSGALPNSIYFLVGHSADYTAYPTFVIYATVSNSGTYDVFVDGIKVATTASGSDTTINWQTTALDSGWEVTTPETLNSHIVRVSASSSSNKITAIKAKHATNAKNGLLWAHFTTTTAVDLDNFCTHQYSYPNTTLLACTCSGKELLVSPRARLAFYNCYNFESIPVLNFNNTTSSFTLDSCIQYTKIKKLIVKNLSDRHGSATFGDVYNLEEIIFENVNFSIPDTKAFYDCSNLRNLPTLNTTHAYKKARSMLSNCTSLQDTVLDFSSATDYTTVTIGASSSAPVTGLKGLTVSNEAPFDDANSPQIDVAYTGLSRAALVNLFKSMPYNVGYTVVGSPTITDGVVSGFSASDRIYANNSITATGNFEYNIKFTTSANVSGNQWIFGQTVTSNLWCGIYTTSYNITISITEENGSQKFCSLAYSLQANTTYTVNVKRINGIVTSTLYDNASTALVSKSETITGAVVFNKNNFGGNPSNYGGNFSGSIDLNKTYIKVNNVPWFTGKAAMTKTCSIVGCTGTAELTQEDKNIVLNKGWELTVA